MTSPAMPDQLAGLAAKNWEMWTPTIWQNGHLTDATRETVIRGCEDYAVWVAHIRSRTRETDPENPEAHEAFLRAIDFQHNFGLTPMGRLAMSDRGGTIGTRVTPPDDEDDDPEATAEFAAEIRREMFQVHDGDVS